jgi:uncharacterized protein YukE
MDVPSIANPWLELFAKVAAAVAVVLLVVQKARKKLHARADEREQRLITAITSRTQPIQPGYRNGGDSMADLAHEQRRMNEQMTTLAETVGVLSVAILGTDNRLTAHINEVQLKEKDDEQDF